MIDELEKYMLGQFLGRGVYRDVFIFWPDQTKVIKIARDDAGRGANITEHNLWERGIQYTPLEKWFAPVLSVSDGGKYLLQERAESLPKEQYPEKIPAFFTDTKYNNFGYIKGKGVVCFDYGSFNVFKNIPTRLVKADWWE